MEFELNDLEKITIDVIEKLQKKNTHVLALSGELGAGKTTFTKALAKKLEIVEEIQSPTFVIAKFYEIKNQKVSWKRLIHIDAYRIESPDELVKLRINEFIADPENLTVIEWAEKVSELIPKGAIRLRLQHINETRRSIDIFS